MCWKVLCGGIALILLGFVVLQFSYETVTAISVLVGVVLTIAAITELGWAFVAPGWRWLHLLLGIAFVIGAVLAFVLPSQTFGTLTLIFAWYLLIKGTYDIAFSLLNHGAHLWWVEMVSGLFELALAFWAVGYPGRSATLLVLWVGLGALMRGITMLVAAFRYPDVPR